MNLHTFKARTMAEALSQVKSVMGHDAVILHARTYQRRRWLGIRRDEIVEITAGKDVKIAPRRTPQTNAYLRAASGGVAARNPSRATANLPTDGSISSAVMSGGQVGLQGVPSMATKGRQLLETAGGNAALMLSLSKEMDGLKTMVRDLVTTTRRQQSPGVPDELFNHYLQLVENQVAEEIAVDLIKSLHRTIRPEHFVQSEFVCEKIAQQIEKMLPISGPIRRTRANGAHVVALVGPTGVGKTTTIAKLAANLKLREHHRVGLITLDTYRIAAIDQLKKYADIIGSPLKVVATPEDLRQSVQAMQNCDFILIDTAGRSPNDTLKINELRTFIAAAAPDEVHLVLSTTSSQKCIELAVSRFSNVQIDKIIFTKLDEAAHVGVVLNVVHKVNKALSYVTTGQDVPDDIEVGRGRQLAQRIMGVTK